MALDTIPQRVMNQAKVRPYRPAYYVKKGGVWRPTTWKEYVGEIRTVARALMSLGFQPGHKVAILGFNRPEWVIFNLAAMSAGTAGDVSQPASLASPARVRAMDRSSKSEPWPKRSRSFA